MERAITIVGLGEALFDVYHDRQILGGAPLNAAVHAHQMAAGLGGCGLPASRIGRDELGRRLIAELESRGVPSWALQQDDERPTGRVDVTLHAGEPIYDIVEDTAWDRLGFSDDWKRLAAECSAVCFGTLGQRSPQARETIERFLQHAPQAIRMFDVNLRQQFFSADLIRRSCALASVVKLNEAELPQVHRLLNDLSESLPHDQQAAALRTRFNLDAVVLTRGAAGTVLYTAAGTTEGAPVSYPPAPRADTVGAGDACAAGVLLGMLLGWPPQRTIALANRAGAFVASQPGATPRLPVSLLELLVQPNP